MTKPRCTDSSLAVSKLTSILLAALASATILIAGGCEGYVGESSEPPEEPPVLGGFAGSTGNVSDGGVCNGGGGAIGSTLVSVGMTSAFPSDPVLPSAPVTAADPPPAISGGTLLMLADGRTAVASDPDRDAIWIVDLGAGALMRSVALQTHDEPGRLVADGAGHVHVILRRAGAVVTVDPTSGAVLERRAVCLVPRGIAYDAGRDLVYVACMEGRLVALPAAGGPMTSTFTLPTDLRDVVVDGSILYVSRFRSAQVLVVDATTGAVTSTITPAGFQDRSVRFGDMFTPSTAWRLRPGHAGGAILLHQRGDSGSITVGPGGYGAGGSCNSIVHPTMTSIQAGVPCPATRPLAGMTLAVDFAESADGSKTAIVAAGNSQSPFLQTLFVEATSDATSAVEPGTVNCGNFGGASGSLVTGTGGDFVPGGGGDTGTGGITGGAGDTGGARGGNSTDAGTTGGMNASGTGSAGTGDIAFDPTQPDGGASPPSGPIPIGSPVPTVAQPTGEVEAVAFDGSDRVVVQTREPATLQIPEIGLTVKLSSVSRADSGHALFHADSGGGIACASCHAEGTEDGRTWQFDCLGPRRTMNVSGGIKARAPYHWTGELPDFPALVDEVYIGRMSGQKLSPDFMDATLSWMDAIPRLPAMTGDPAAVARGETIFNDRVNVGCVTCHSGPSLTTNAIVDVGTGGKFKVPSLTGIAWQAPYMHSGCAATLSDRFSATCGGGDLHGVTSTLSSAQITDLVAYLQTL
jgi:mono/diheme cytochrome c family protein